MLLHMGRRNEVSLNEISANWNGEKVIVDRNRKYDELGFMTEWMQEIRI